MKLKFNNKYVKWGFTAFCVIAAGLCFYYLIFHLSNIISNVKGLLNVVMPVVFGLVIAYLLTPILNFIEKKILNPLCDLCKIKQTKKRNSILRALAILLTTVLVIFLIYELIAMLVSEIVPSIQAIVSNFDRYVSDLSAWLNKLLEDNPDLKNFVLPQVNNISLQLEKKLEVSAELLAKSTEVLKTVSLSILSFLKVTWNFVIGFVISIYVLASKELFSAQSKKIVYATFERKTANSILEKVRFIHRTFIGFVSGKVLDSIIIGMLCFVGTTIMGTPYAALVSLIVGVTNVIPFFGPYLGAIPSALLILFVDLSHPLNCVYFLIFILFLQQLDGNLIGPMILGDSTGLSGFWVIFSITVFGGMFGIPGMIVGVPIFAVIYAAIKGIVNRSLLKKNLPIDSKPYRDMDCIDEEGVFHDMDVEQPGYMKKPKKDNFATFKKLFHFKKKDASKQKVSKSKPKKQDEVTTETPKDSE